MNPAGFTIKEALESASFLFFQGSQQMVIFNTQQYGTKLLKSSQNGSKMTAFETGRICALNLSRGSGRKWDIQTQGTIEESGRASGSTELKRLARDDERQ